jgi:hypothetical protein
MVGVLATEHSPFGYLTAARDAWGGDLGRVGKYKTKKKSQPRSDSFNDLYIRTWRDRARYAGPEALGQEGPTALMRLPAIMEEILDYWERSKKRPNFKAEYIVTHAIVASLNDAAKVSAERLKMNSEESAALMRRYVGYTRELSGPGAKPVPPHLFSIAKDSRDHSPEVYRKIIIPGFRAMKPQPKVWLTRFEAGVHTFWHPEKDLPMGIAPCVVRLWNEAVMSGFFVV